MSAYLFEKIFTFRLWNNLFTTSTITSSLAAYVQQLDQSDLSHNGIHQLHSLLIHDKNSLYYNEYNTLLDYISGSGQGIVGPVSMNGISLNDKQYLYSNLHRYNMNYSTHIYYDRNGTINDWYHRWNLDRYTVLYGMCFAFLILSIENYDAYKKLGIKRKQCQQLASKLKTIFCLLSLLILIIYFIVLFLCSNKAICDEIHPYIVILPITSYILLRNIPTFLRQYYSPFFSWFGNISLELFVTQYHIWLVANGHGTLTIIPRMPTLNLIITTFIFICCCHELHRITNILAPVFVPNDSHLLITQCGVTFLKIFHIEKSHQIYVVQNFKVIYDLTVYKLEKKMPLDGSSTELLNTQNSTKKKRSNKKRRPNRKLPSKTRLLDGNEANGQSSSGIKNALNSNRCDLNKLTPANIASLRWDNALTDPTLENERIERYKELRRQRYIDARQHAIQILMEQMQVTVTNATTGCPENE
ncbi:unnamed protein product [Rotaria magnacalcarata]|nr:unnamed protein product [Rotaria magnacalcarata]